MTFNELKEKATEFSERKFGYDNKKRLLPVAHKYIEESNELFDAIKSNVSVSEVNDEFADCFLLLVDLYRLYHGNDVDMQTLIDISSKKLDKCESREWGTPDENGVFHHK